MFNKEKFSNDEILKCYQIQLSEVVACKRFTASTRLLAANLMENPYHTVGNFFKKLSDEQLSHLSYLSEISDSEDQSESAQVDELVILTLMLLQAEGTLISTEDEFMDAVGMFKMMIAGTSLNRKGLIRVNYENMSFNTDAQDKIVFEPDEGE